MNLSSTPLGMEGGTEWVMGALKEAASVPGALTGVGRRKKQGEGILRVEVSLLCGDLNTDWSSTVRQCALQKCTPGLASTGLPPFFLPLPLPLSPSPSLSSPTKCLFGASWGREWRRCTEYCGQQAASASHNRSLCTPATVRLLPSAGLYIATVRHTLELDSM